MQEQPKERAVIFEPQHNADGFRRCGAAALLMVYRSLGMDDASLAKNEKTGQNGALSQERIFEEIGRDTRTYRLAEHAIHSGLTAMIARLCDPWEGLATFLEGYLDGRSILNIRPTFDSHRGHFVYVCAMSPGNHTVVLHDPQFGPDRRLSRAELLELWTPRGPHCEIRGRIGVFLRASPPADRPDSASTDDFQRCDHCGMTVNPGGFRKILPFCEYLFCPSCDHPHPLPP